MDLVSVIIPTYNREKLIERSVMSVLNQSYSHLELIVVDDCSTDNTLEVLAKIHDDRLKVYKNEKNQGANFSRNFGVLRAKGKYVAFHDSDDVWRINKLEVFVREIKDRQCDIVFSGMMRYGKNYKRYLPIYNLNNYENKYRQLLMQNCVSTQNMMGKREAFLSIKFDERQKKMQDWDIMLRFAQARCSIYYIDQALTDAYIQGDSITNLQGSFDSLNRIYHKHEKYIDKDSELKQLFLLNLGKASWNNRKKSLGYIKRALLIKMDLNIIIIFILEALGLFGVFQKSKNVFRWIFSKFGLWDMIAKI